MRSSNSQEQGILWDFDNKIFTQDLATAYVDTNRLIIITA